MATPTTHVRPPLWRDVRVLRVVAQLAFLVLLVVLAIYLWDNLNANLQQRNLPGVTDFGFLDQAAGFRTQSPGFGLSDLSGAVSVLDGYILAAKATAIAAGIGIALCTVLGLLVGIARLSTNWLVRTSATIYVEAFRNIPPLLLIVFTFSAVLLKLPRITEATELGGVLVISNRGLAMASPTRSGNLGVWLLIVAVTAVAAVGIGAWRTRVYAATGEPHHRLLWAGVPFVLVAVVSFLLLDGPIGLSRPEAGQRSIAGGVEVSIPFTAVVLALGIYTSTHVAETVRGSILAVHRGQTEASSALGLSSFQRLRFVVLPQAFRIAIPPTINQYLNLTKNTSLGIAVSLIEITAFTNISIGNRNPATQSVVLLMATYLSFSLIISLVLNLYGRRIRLVER